FDGIFGTADDATETTTTDANGSYHFTGLPAGDYKVSVDAGTLPAGVVQTYDFDDATGPFNSANQATYSLAAGESFQALDFGYVLLGTIGDRPAF
ncbi:MAG: hypothetical protein HGB05_19370, partial [Chloroflexi bacterium]|nr:hypothetical protein [Chloroflexota bacterium]